MAITDKKPGVWGLDQTYNKINQGSIWNYSAFGDAGTLWSMGYNNGGDLGQNNRTKYSSPVQIPGTWKDIGGVKSDGTLWSWGYNSIGALGLNDTTNRSSPVQVGSDTTWNSSHGMIDNSDSEKEAFGIKTDGTLWAWGWNHIGQLGLNDAGGPGPTPSQRQNSRSSPTQIPGTTWPTTGYNKFGWSLSYLSSAAIKTDGTLWVWGASWQGALGQNSETYYSSPVQIPGTTWKSISRGLSYSFTATKTDGTLWAWGKNEYGSLGQNNTTRYSSPVQIGSDTDWDITSGGSSTGSAVKTDGTLWVWGYNRWGQLGQNQDTPTSIPAHTSCSSPVQIPGTTWTRPVQMPTNSMGAMKTDGTVWVWGFYNGGALGQNYPANYHSPVQIPGAGINLRGSTSVAFVMKEA